MRRFLGLALLTLSCSSHEAPSTPVTSALPPGVVARTGDELVGAETVARVAAARRVSAYSAAQLAVTDAVLAVGARANLPDATVRTIERAAHARALLEELAVEASKRGPPSAAELEELRRERWVDLERPDAVRTTHALVLNDKPERAAEARLVAEKLGAQLSSVTTGDELIRAARAFDAGGFEVRAESLPFVTADGRTFARTETGLAPRGAGFDVAFAKAANAIGKVGTLGPLVESSFGYHVILLEERMTGISTPEVGLVTLLGPEVIARRGSKARRELLDRLRGGAAIGVERAADDLTAKIQLSP
jgi:hypothetical protein